MSIGVGLFPANTLTSLQRRPSLAFNFGTFAYAKDQASLLHDGLLMKTRHHTPMTYMGLIFNFLLLFPPC